MQSITAGSNNLYQAWYIYEHIKQNDGTKIKTTEQLLSEAETSLGSKSQFLSFIESYCADKLIEYKVKENVHFDKGLFEETMMMIENYYKLEGKLKLITKAKM